MLNIRQRKVKQKLKRLLVIIFALYIVSVSILTIFQEKIIFRPVKLPQNFDYSRLDYPFEETFLKTSDGASINLLHLKAENPKGAILYFHGNSGNLDRWAKITEYFVELDYDVYVMDYRTYGKSSGVLDQQLLYDDAQLCYNYVQKSWEENKIIVYGRSLGTTFATYVAAKNSPEQLILETPYHSIADVAQKKYPIFPVRFLLRYQFPSYTYISKVNCPISIIHGTNDAVVPLSSGKKLYQYAPKENITLTIIENGKHNNLIEFEEYHQRIKDLL